MSKDKPLRDWGTWIFRGVLAGLIWWAVDDWREFKIEIRAAVAQHTKDIAFLSGRLAGGRVDR